MRMRTGLAFLALGGIVSLGLMTQYPSSDRSNDEDLLEVLHRKKNQRPKDTGLPNIVLVVGCTARRDQLTPYKPQQPFTPFLQQLAEGGTRFADVIAAAPWTKPAMTAILTGRHAASVGMVEPGDGLNEQVLSSDVTTLASALRRHGYVTIGATANPNLHAQFGFSAGFDTYIQPARLWRDGAFKIPGGELLSHFFAEIDRQGPQGPLYAQLLLIDAHAPLAPVPTPDPQIPKEVQRYRAALTTLDEQIASLHQGLQDRGMLEDTLFVFVSDHGEGLEWPAHHGRSHGRYLYASAVEAAWILSGPTIPAGKVVTGISSQVDIAPTLLGLLGIPRIGGGLDLSSAIRGPSSHTNRQEAFSDTWFLTANRASVWTSDQVCMQSFSVEPTPGPTGRFVPGCYSRVLDPLQLQPFQDDGLIRVQEWRTEILSAPGEKNNTSPELRQQLEQLGYIDP